MSTILPYGRYQGHRPINARAARDLQDVYAAAGPPWTRDAAIALGRLYVAAWGKVPNAHRMQAAYCLPCCKTILKLFGSVAAYYAALAPKEAA